MSFCWCFSGRWDSTQNRSGTRRAPGHVNSKHATEDLQQNLNRFASLADNDKSLTSQKTSGSLASANSLRSMRTRSTVSSVGSANSELTKQVTLNGLSSDSSDRPLRPADLLKIPSNFASMDLTDDIVSFLRKPGETRVCFAEYLCENYAIELLLFWDAVDVYLQAHQGKEKTQEAMEQAESLYSVFLGSDSQYCLSVGYDVAKEFDCSLSFNESGYNQKRQTRDQVSLAMICKLFRNAQQQIEKRLHTYYTDYVSLVADHVGRMGDASGSRDELNGISNPGPIAKNKRPRSQSYMTRGVGKTPAGAD